MKQFHHIQVVHLHPDNSTRRQRRGSEYLTIAKVYDDLGTVIATAVSKCSPEDKPSRQVGYELAVGRVVKQLHQIPNVVPTSH